MSAPLRFITPEARLLERLIEDENGCWIWQGANTGTSGYGIMVVNRRRTLTHRLSYELFVGPIPAGLVIDHLCRVHACANPKHLEVVTSKENSHRGDLEDYWRKRREATHCAAGHEYPDDVYISARGQRKCRPCEARRMRGYREAKKVAG